MANYGDRRRTSISQYIDGLNVLPVDGAAGGDTFDFDDNLNIFAETEFFDFETGTHTDFHAPIDSSSVAPKVGGEIDVLADALNFPPVDPSLNNFFLLPPQTSDALYQGVPQTQFDTTSYLPQPTAQQQQLPISSPAGPTTNQSSPLSLEDLSRTAGEEDKRKRNTAASARFRVKKKQREQALEKHVKDMSDNIKQLESKIQSLETENKWLKTLVLEKNSADKSSSEVKAEVGTSA